MARLYHNIEQGVERVVKVFIRADRFDDADDLWFARSSFIYTYIGAFVALSYAVFYWIFHSYGASLSLSMLCVALIVTTPLHLFGKSRLLAKINLASTSLGLAGVVIHMGGVDSSAACWMLGVTPGITALLFRRAKEIFQLTAFTLCLYAIIFVAELSGFEVYYFSYPEGSTFERVYTFIHFTAFSMFIAIALAIFATTQRKLLREVGRQAREVKAILANIRQGIFTITTPDLAIGEESSKYLEKIVEHQSIQGLSAMDLIFQHGDLNSEQKDMVGTIMSSCIKESSLNFFANEDNLVREMIFRTKDGNKEKMLLIDWQPIVNEKSDLVEKVLVTLSDVTELKHMEKQNKRQQREIEIIMEISEVSAEKFEQFMRSAERFLDENRRISEVEHEEQDVKILFINMHTLKGAARTYRLHHMTAVIHDCEQYYAQLQRKEVKWSRVQALENLKTVEDVFAEYESINRGKLKRGDVGDKIRIDIEAVQESIRFLKNIEGYAIDDHLTPFVNHVKHTFYGLYYVEAETLFEDICRTLPALAKDLGKACPQVNVKSIAAGLSGEGCEILRNSFVHILRNSMDHGIEFAEQRQANGKDPFGSIDIDISMTQEGALQIRYADNGQGLQLDQLLAKSVNQGLLRADEANKQIIAEMIFHPGLSTAKSVTEISGRGVGMGCVREFIEKAGGTIELVLARQDGPIQACPFHFVIMLPGKYFAPYQFKKNVA